MLVGLDDPGREAVSKQMTPASTARVGVLREPAIQHLHAVGKTLLRRFDNQVVMRAEQTQGVHVPVESRDYAGEETEEVTPVVVVEKQICLLDGESGGVVDAIR
jgi:hypothetical protein